MIYRPPQSAFRYALALLALMSAGLAVWLWMLLTERVGRVEFDGGVFLLGLALTLALVLAGMAGYIAWCAASMRYRVDDRAFQIWVSGVQHIVPLESINAVYAPGEEVDGKPVEVLWKRINPPLPGYVVGGGISMQLGNVVSVSALPVSRQVFVATPGLAFGISPRNPEEFVKHLSAKLKPQSEGVEGDEEEVDALRLRARPRTRLSGLSAWGAPLWGDTVSRALFLGGLAFCALLFGYLGAVYASLPDNVPIHWDAQAQPDLIGGPVELLRLPAFALGIWGFNVVVARLVVTRERAATLFLLAGGLAVQVVFAAAMMSIVLRAI
jgi:hypothetical protein